ncbi:MAG: CerR family C-terminal domain-containing protein [Desulfobacteraceae bacterium]|nr:CerR family C-terminal domain-containing protein [Desulfobacteraceae bacterium]
MNIREIDDTKKKLIEAAGEIFAQKSFRFTTVREICKLAGTHVGSVNYHFRDKEGLYEAVLQYSHIYVLEKYPPDLGLTQTSTPQEKLRAFIHSFLLRILDEGVPAWHGKLMAQEFANPTNAVHKLIEKSIKPLHLYLGSIVRELLQVEKGHRNETAVFLCSQSIVGQCLQYFKGKEVIEAICPRGFSARDVEMLTEQITLFSLGGIQETKKQIIEKK